MKVLIWFACICVGSLIQTLLRKAGIMLGGIPTFILFGLCFYIAKKLCDARDDKEKPTEKKVEPKGKPCPNCGNHISHIATVCSHCGYALQNNQSSTAEDVERTCPMCGQKISAGFSSCSYCGYYLKPSATSTTPEQNNTEDGGQLTQRSESAQIQGPTKILPEGALPSDNLTSSDAAEKIRFCRRCGFKLLEDSEYCSQCGTKIIKENNS